MKYKLIQKKNPQAPEAPKKWYASPVNVGTLTLSEIASEIAGRSSLTQGDVENVLRNLLEQMPVFLRIGMSVKLGDFGIFRLSLSSEGKERPEEFSGANIRNIRILFTPSKTLKASIASVPVEQLTLTPGQEPENEDDNPGA